MDNVKQLAQAMKVSEDDLLSFARLVADAIERDNLAEFFVSDKASEHRRDLTLAYMSDAVERFEQFHTSYMTNRIIKNLFNDVVYAKIKYNEEGA